MIRVIEHIIITRHGLLYIPFGMREELHIVVDILKPVQVIRGAYITAIRNNLSDLYSTRIVKIFNISRCSKGYFNRQVQVVVLYIGNPFVELLPILIH